MISINPAICPGFAVQAADDAGRESWAARHILALKKIEVAPWVTSSTGATGEGPGLRRMFIRIKPEEIEIGMFVESFEGSWFDHPFWRRRFRVETRDQVQRIRASGIDGLMIDTSRGGPVCEAFAAAPGAWSRPEISAPRRLKSGTERSMRPGALTPSVASLRAAPQPSRKRDRAGYAAECRRARKTIDRSAAAVAEMFEAARLGRAVEARRMVPLAQAVGASIERDAKALINLVRLKEKDRYTYLHSVAVCALMMNFARHLGLEEQVIADLGVAGLLHDVGKVVIDDDILGKNGALSDQERDVVRSHPEAGHRMLAQSRDVPDAALEICLRHHERMDGRGYPGGLADDALTLFARMGAICDVYDAVTSERPYKRPWTPCEALTRMQGWEGHFDPRLLEKFADSLGIYPVGTLVRLSNDELAIVRGSGGEHDEMVLVRSFFDCGTLTEIAPVDRAIAPSAAHPRIVSRDSPRFWRFDDWEGMRGRVLAAEAAQAAA